MQIYTLFAEISIEMNAASMINDTIFILLAVDLIL